MARTLANLDQESRRIGEDCAGGHPSPRIFTQPLLRENPQSDDSMAVQFHDPQAGLLQGPLLEARESLQHLVSQDWIVIAFLP